jgi:DNA mismatch repair ATPase MutS
VGRQNTLTLTWTRPIPISIQNSFHSSIHFRWYRWLTQHQGNHIRLFERKEDGYTVYGKDALFVAEWVYKTTTVLQYYGSNRFPICCISTLNARPLLGELLLQHHYCVEIWTVEGKKWMVSKKVIGCYVGYSW